MFRPSKKPSPQFVNTLNALDALLQSEGREAVSDAYRVTVQDRIREDFAKTNGLKQSSGRVCIQRILGKRCRVGHQGVRCACTPPGSDHVSLWAKDGKPFVYVSQPFQLTTFRLPELLQFCEEHGLEMSISTFPDWHRPGSVLAVLFTAKGTYLK